MTETNRKDLHPYILYALPVSRTTQSVRQPNPQKAWNKVSEFLAACTTNPRPKSLELNAYTSPEDHSPRLPQVIQQADDLFGKGKSSSIGIQWETKKRHPHRRIEWSIDPSALATALDFMFAGQPWPKFVAGPVQLIISWRFSLVDSHGKILPSQDHPSSILLWLTQSSQINVALCFPFAEPDSDFYAYLKYVENMFPGNLDRKFLRHGIPTKKGSGFRFKKIIEPGPNGA